MKSHELFIVFMICSAFCEIDFFFFYLNISRYEPQIDGIDENRRKEEVKKINSELLKKLQEFDTEIVFSTGRYKYCIPAGG